MNHSFKESRGFTMIELLVVISIIALLSAIVLAAVGNARAKGSLAAGREFSVYNYHAFGIDAYAEWDFDENTSGQVALDTSGNNSTLTFTGSGIPVWTTSTYSGTGRAMQLNLNIGNTEYAPISKIMNFPVTNNATNLTFGASVQTTSAGNLVIVSLIGNNGTQFGMCISGGHLDYMSNAFTGFGHSDYCDGTYKGNTLVNDGAWHYVTLSIDINKNMNLYVDGRLDTSFSGVSSAMQYMNMPSATNGAVSTNGAVAAYAGSYPSFSQYFVGSLDEVHIYSHSLTAMEVGKIYAEGSPRHILADAQK